MYASFKVGTVILIQCFLGKKPAVVSTPYDVRVPHHI